MAAHSIRFSQCGTGSIAPNFWPFNHNLWRLIKLLIRAVSFSIRAETVNHEHMCASAVLHIELKRRNVYLILSLNTTFFVPFKSHLDILIASEPYACVSAFFLGQRFLYLSSLFFRVWTPTHLSMVLHRHYFKGHSDDKKAARWWKAPNISETQLNSKRKQVQLMKYPRSNKTNQINQKAAHKRTHVYYTHPHTIYYTYVCSVCSPILLS